MIQANGHNTEQSNHDQSISARVKCSYPITHSNRNDDNQKLIAIPAAKPLGSMIDKDRSYMSLCSYCNIKIGLGDPRFHIKYEKTSDVQKADLENANYLVRPNACLCVGCYQTIKKRTSTNKYIKRACIIMACEQVACHIFNSKLIDVLKYTILINKIHFRVQTNEEKKLHKTSFCSAHYDQLLLITQCQLCGNRSLQKFKFDKDILHEYQLILDEDNIPVTIKYDTLICKPCHIYLLLRRDKTTIIPSDLQKHCDATKTRIINNNKLKTKELESIKLAKYEVNMEKNKEENQLLMITSLPKNISNFFIDYSSMPSKSVTKGSPLDDITTPPPLVNSTLVAASMQSLTAAITTTIEPALATEEAHLTSITKPILETPINATLTKANEDVKLTVATGKPKVLILKRKRQHTLLDKHSSVPRTKKRIVNRPTVNTDCIKHTMSEHKPTIPVHKPTITGIKPTTPVNVLTIPIHKPSVQVLKTTTPVNEPTTQSDKSTTPVDKPTTRDDKPTIPVHKPLYNKSLSFTPVLRPIFSKKWPVPKKQPFKILNVPFYKPTIADHKCLYKKSIVFSPVLRPYFNSKHSIPKKHKKTPESISPIRKQTKLQTNQSHQNTLDSRSTSPRTEFSELSHQQAGPSILSSTTSDMNQVFENIKVQIDKPVIPVHKPTIPGIKPRTPVSKLTIPIHKPSVQVVKTTTPVNEPKTRADKSMTPVDKPTTLIDKPTTPVDKPTTPVDKRTISVHKPLYNKSLVGPPVISPFFSSKCTELKKNGNPLESVSPIIGPTQLQENQLHQKTLYSRSTSPRTEFSELSHQQAGPSILSSTTSDMNQVFENIKVQIDKPVIPVHKPTIPGIKPRTPVNKLTIPIHKPSVQVVKTTTPVNEPKTRADKSMTPVDKPTTLIDKPTTPVDKPTTPVDKRTISVHKPLYNKSLVGPPVISPFFSSKCTELKKNGNPLESVSPIIEPTQLQENQLHQHTLDSQSTSPRTEFPELRRQRAGPTTLSSTTPYMIQLFEKLKSPYPNGMTFINHLLNLETCRHLGTLTVEKNKTTYRQQTSNTATTPPHSIHCLPAQKEYQTVSRTDDDDNDLTNSDYLSDKCVPSDENSSDSHFIPVKKTFKSCNIPKQKSNLPKSFGNKPSQYYDNGDSKKQVIDLQDNSSITYYPDITAAATTSTITMSITTTEASTNIVSATSPVFTTIAEAIIASEVPATVEMAAVATNTSAVTTAVADSTTSITDSTTAINNTEVPVITDTVTINYDKSEITSTINENTTFADAAAVEESATLYNTTALTMITNVASTTTNSAVSAAIDSDSFTAVTTTVTDDTTSVEINTVSSTITNAIITGSPNSAKCNDTFTTINASPVASDITTTTETIFGTTIAASKISYD